MNTLVKTENFATLILINNPFNPKDHSRHDVIVSEKPTISKIMPKKYGDYVVSLNGEIVNESEFESRLIKQDDYIVCSPIPQGGGGESGSKTMLRMVSMIAIAYFAPYALGQYTSLQGFALHGASMLAIAGGSMLVNAIIPIKPNVPVVEQDLNASTSYGIDGPKNTSAEGVVVPVVYGTYRVGGNVVNLFTRNTDEETQDLYMQIVLSEGEIGGISRESILINDQSIDDFKDSDMNYALGKNDDNSGTRKDASGWFSESVGSTAVGVTLTTAFQSRTTATEVDKIRIDLIAPLGFRRIDNTGKSWAIREDISIEYRKQGVVNWTALNATHKIGEYETLYVLTHRFKYDLSLNQPGPQGIYLQKWDEPHYVASLTSAQTIDGHYQDLPKLTVTSEGLIKTTSAFKPYRKVVGYVEKVPKSTESPSIRGNYRAPYRLSFESEKLEQGFYEVRVKRDTEESIIDTRIDKLSWVDLSEILDEEVQLINTAWLGIKIRLDDQLNSIPKVTCVVSGKLIKTIFFNRETFAYEENSVASNNPAWITYDAMTNSRYGGNIAESRLILEDFIDWADHCTENDLTFDGIFDTDMSIWDAIQAVMRAGHAQLINIGTKFSVAIERPALPVMMFNVGNIIEKTFNMSWLPISDRANEIEVTYFDEENNYLPSTIRVSNIEVPGSDQKRTAELKLYGTTNVDKATKEAKLMLNINRFILTTVSFEAPIEAIACTIGDVVYIQHDIPQWSFGGRLDANSTTAQTGFQLDRPVQIEAGKNYSLLLTFDNLIRITSTIDAIISDRYVRLSNTLPLEPIKTAVINGVEYSVISTFTDSLGEGVYVDRAVPTNTVGMQCALYDTDVIETKTLTSVTVGGPGSYTTISVDQPFTVPASKYTKFIFGETTKVKRLFRIQNISGGGDLTRKISALEYNELVYDDDGIASPTPNYSSLPAIIPHVTNLQAFQESRVVGSVFIPVVVVTWDRPDDDRYAGAEISVREENGQWRPTAGVSRGATEFQYMEAVAGQILEFRVIARDTIGGMAPASKAPFVSLTIAQIGPTLDAPSNLAVIGKRTAVEITWSNPDDSPSYSATRIFRGTVNNFADPSVSLIHTTNGESYTDSDIQPGTQYFYWAKSVSTEGVVGDLNNAAGTTLAPPSPPTGVALTNGFEGETASIEWNSQANAYRYIVEVRTNSILRRSASLIHTNYSYGINEMTADGYVNRAVEFQVKVQNIMGQTSTATTLATTNQAPLLPTAIALSPGFQILRVSYDIPTDPDYKETRIWMSTTTGFTPSTANLVAQSYGGPILISNLETNTTYYIRMATFDTFGQGQMSGEWAETTLDSQIPNLGPWATVTNADKVFIDANLGDNSVESVKINKLVASKIVTGTLAATESISVEGSIEAFVGPYNVTMGPKQIGGSTALFSFMAGSTPVVAFFEDGTAQYTGQISITSGSSGFGNFSDKPSDNDLLNNRTENTVTMIPRPVGATKTVGALQAGAIVIVLPMGWSNTMMRMVIDVYLYGPNNSFSLAVGGYNHVASSAWINTFAQISGSLLSDNRVRFGINASGKNCIVIGETTTNWNYPSIAVKDFQAAFSNYALGLWNDGWEVTFATSLVGYTFTPSADYSDALIDAKGIVGQGALATADNVAWVSQINGMPNFLKTPVGTGLFASDTHLGFYDTGVPKSYMDNTGAFYLAGSDPDNYLTWNGTTLTVRGDINATSITTSIAKIGLNAGLTGQGLSSLAIGDYSGETNQSNESLAVGSYAGNLNQGNLSAAIGYKAGTTTQGGLSVAVGAWAGENTQGVLSIAIGAYSGKSSQSSSAIAIGVYAGETTQTTQSIAIGAYAGQLSQATKSIAIGYISGNSNQGSNSVAIGTEAGRTSQGNQSIALGNVAGKTSQGANSIAIGYDSGSSTQGTGSVAIGSNAGKTSQGIDSVAIGYDSGSAGQGARSVLIGKATGYGILTTNRTTGLNAVAIGVSSVAKGDDSVVIGTTAGYFGNGQGSASVSIGDSSRAEGSNCVTIGRDSYIANTAYNNSTALGASSNCVAANQITLGDINITSLRCNVTSISSLSDARDKEVIATCPVGLQYICDLTPVEFTWKYRPEHFKEGVPPSKEGTKEIGFLAQNLKEVQDKYNVPSLKSYHEYFGEDTEIGIDTIEADQGKLIPVLVRAIQELKQELDTLKEEIKKKK